MLYSFNFSKLSSIDLFLKSDFSGFVGLLRSVLLAAFYTKVPKPNNVAVVIMFSNVSRPKFAHSLLFAY